MYKLKLESYREMIEMIEAKEQEISSLFGKGLMDAGLYAILIEDLDKRLFETLHPTRPLTDKEIGEYYS